MESFIHNAMHFEAFIIRGELKMDVFFCSCGTYSTVTWENSGLE
jgi:hypothetical protein